MSAELALIQSCTVDMLLIKCPYCGKRDHSEFTYGSDASIKYPNLDASTEEWVKAIFFREHIRGVQKETWHHLNGCRMWLEVERSTETHEIISVKPCHPNLQKLFESNNES